MRKEEEKKGIKRLYIYNIKYKIYNIRTGHAKNKEKHMSFGRCVIGVIRITRIIRISRIYIYKLLSDGGKKRVYLIVRLFFIYFFVKERVLKCQVV